MKIGNYVRTKSGYIRKIENVDIEDGTPIYLDKPILEDDTKWRNCYQVMGCIQEENIIKSSPNIIDLIEVGDYVNGYRVCELIEKGCLGYYESSLGTIGKKAKEKSICLNNNYVMKFTNREIENVVTKEQFESMEYKIGE